LPTSIYEPSIDSVCLRQGEILSGLVRHTLDAKKFGDHPLGMMKTEHPYVVVMSQACDLEQDFNVRMKDGTEQLPDVLFCQLPTAEQLRSGISGSEIWKRIKSNKDERYHFFEKIMPECDLLGSGLPELGADFKRYFTVPTAEVYRWLELGITQRRSVLTSPYLEHLSTRFSYFLSRVGLPHNHVSE
jgi:hypothetical protein